MIFVTVGSSVIPFNRLLRAIDQVGVDERLVVQHGPSPIRPKQAECVDIVDHAAFLDLVREARVVVMHAGVGSIIAALAERKRPVVIPRHEAFGEAVDDHQISFARRAAALGFIRLVEDVDDLAAALSGDGGDAPELGNRPSPIEIELRSYIETCAGPTMARTPSERSGA